VTLLNQSLKKLLVLTKESPSFVEYRFGGDEDIFNSIAGFELRIDWANSC
tara:strand:+ start:362 stop:511 length:150 start_codon:yes stop_codon:yes gene_type:complete